MVCPGDHPDLVTEIEGRTRGFTKLRAKERPLLHLFLCSCSLDPHGDLPRGGFCSPSECVKKQNGETWCQKHLADQQLFQLLQKVDGDFAEEAHQQGCLFCGGNLHRANYDRKPRGGPQWDWRFSFCCAKEDCRRRRTPPSVRFLGRKVYAGLVVVL